MRSSSLEKELELVKGEKDVEILELRNRVDDFTSGGEFSPTRLR